MHDLERGELGRGDHQVVREVRRLGLAVVRIAHGFEERLCHTLGDPAVHLTVGEQRVQDLAGIVQRHEARQPSVARLGVDLDDGEVRAEGEGGHHRGEVALCLQRFTVGPRQLCPVDDLGGCARDVEHAALRVDHHVVGRALEHVGRARASKVDERAGRRVDRRAPDLHGARPDREATRAHLVGVAVHHLDLLDRHTGAF